MFCRPTHPFSDVTLQATNPDWNPTDPSGSQYLSRMTDLNNHFQYPYYRRRHGQGSSAATDLAGGVHFLSDPPSLEGGQPSKAHDYDHALRQSRMAAAIRRRQGGSVLGISTLMPGPSTGASMYGEIGTATSAVLGDSQGSEKLTPTVISPTKSPRNNHTSAIMEEEDGNVGSVLGESYVHGEEKTVSKVEDEEELEDGGVLGLLAQIYGRKDGPAVM